MPNIDEKVENDDNEKDGLAFQSSKDIKSTTTRPSTCTQCNKPFGNRLDKNKNMTRSAAFFTNKNNSNSACVQNINGMACN